MKEIYQKELDEIVFADVDPHSFLSLGETHRRPHDDNDGDREQCLEMTFNQFDSERVYIQLDMFGTSGLRFRNYCGGGMSLRVHNALKLCVYATTVRNMQTSFAFLDDLEEESAGGQISENIDDLLDGVIALPPSTYAGQSGARHYFFEVINTLKIGISVDGDTHLLGFNISTVVPQGKVDDSITIVCERHSFTFLQKECSKPLFNALIVLMLAIKKDNEEVRF